MSQQQLYDIKMLKRNTGKNWTEYDRQTLNVAYTQNALEILLGTETAPVS